MLLAYDWPGNIRQLQNVVEHAIAVRRGDIIHIEDLPKYLQNYGSGFRKRIMEGQAC